MRFVTDQMFGPYRLIKSLGRGNYGEVWLGVDTRNGQSAALKFPAPGTMEQNQILQEVTVWTKASHHPNVLPCRGVEIYNNQMVIVTDYAPDGTLRDWLRRNGGVAALPEPALEMMLGILAGLEHLHNLGIVHRDLKPENIAMFGNTPRLMDFGLARMQQGSVSVSQAIGTPLYMAPEVFSGERSRQGDQWAVAVIFYEMLTGAPPFVAGNDVMALMTRILRETPAPLPAAIPPFVRSTILRALEKDRLARFPSVSEMRNALLQQAHPGKPIARLLTPVLASGLCLTGVATVLIASHNASLGRQAYAPYQQRANLPSPAAFAPSVRPAADDTEAQSARAELAALYHDMDYNYTEKFPGYFTPFSSDYLREEYGETKSFDDVKRTLDQEWATDTACTLETEIRGKVRTAGDQILVPFRQRLQNDRMRDDHLYRSLISTSGEDTWQKEDGEWKLVHTTVNHRTVTGERQIR